ncbi:hypothetical protein [Methyloceanibacter sp.]|uniref:hypothetical protein n=1 Tax=Methyloceanibacter sp. TaxID=1965321 RepID=UPI003D6D00F7
MLQRKLEHLACTVAVSAIAAAGLTLAGTKPVLAEFEIQEAGIEKGEVELEYRGAYHWGVPRATDENENANDLVQSNEIELQMGISDWWMISVTSGFDKPLGGDLQATAVEVETQFGLVKREGSGLGLAFQMGYEKAINNHKHLDDAEANQFGFGPIVELATGKFLLTLNPLFTRQLGTYANQEGLGFEYGWRGEYDFTKRWGVGVEMFGEIEDLANAGSFNDQVHSIGPTLFYNLGGNNDEAKGGDDDEGGGGDTKVSGPAEMALSMNVGLQFGLTDATSDTALKFQGSLSF